MLTEEGHNNKIYSLPGDPADSFADIAKILSDIRGTSVRLIPVTDEEYIANYIAEGLPGPVAAFALAWVHGTNIGERGELTGDLERLIGHKTITTAEFLRHNYPVVIPQIEALRVNKAA